MKRFEHSISFLYYGTVNDLAPITLPSGSAIDSRTPCPEETAGITIGQSTKYIGTTLNQRNSVMKLLKAEPSMALSIIGF